MAEGAGLLASVLIETAWAWRPAVESSRKREKKMVFFIDAIVL